MSIPRTVTLASALDAEGFPLPEECREIKLVMATGAVFVVQYEVMLTDERMEQFALALITVAKEHQP